MINSLAWGWPQYIFILLIIIDIGYTGYNQGRTETRKYNIIPLLLSQSLILFLLISGNFFN
jgi:hypothetical protein